MNLKTSDKMMDFRTEFKETLNGAVHWLKTLCARLMLPDQFSLFHAEPSENRGVGEAFFVLFAILSLIPTFHILIGSI